MTTSAGLKKAQAALSSLSTPSSSTSIDWEKAWTSSTTPWETGHAHHSIRPTLTKYRPGLPPSPAVALVPGCGSARDALALAEVTGLETVAIDISATAVEVARRTCADLITGKGSSSNSSSGNSSSSGSRAGPAGSSTATTGNSNSRLSFIVGDFFEYRPPSAGVSVVLDHTFMACLPPTMRPDWARKMAEIVKRDGLLVCIMFPVGVFEGGPPFATTEATYKDLIDQQGGFELLECGPVPHDLSHPKRRGRESIGVWRKT